MSPPSSVETDLLINISFSLGIVPSSILESVRLEDIVDTKTNLLFLSPYVNVFDPIDIKLNPFSTEVTFSILDNLSISSCLNGVFSPIIAIIGGLGILLSVVLSDSLLGIFASTTKGLT